MNIHVYELDLGAGSLLIVWSTVLLPYWIPLAFGLKS